MPDFLDFINKGFAKGGEEQATLTETDEAIVENKNLNENSPLPIDTSVQPTPNKTEELPQGELPQDEPTALEQGQEAYTQNNFGLNVQAENRHVESDPGTWTPEYTQMGFVEKTRESLLRGFGKHVVGGTGDMIQMANLIVPGWELAEGNMLSRALQDSGTSFADKHQIFMPEEMRDPKFNLKTFMDPNFWSGHVAEYIPQLVEFIFLSKGASGLLKGGAKKLANKVNKETAKKIGRQTTYNTTEQIAKGAAQKSIRETGGKGLGKLITQSGDASKLALTGTEVLGGGISMNILSGALNAAQQINELKDQKDADGNLIYDDADLKAIASGTMIHNLKYLPVDMLSWGLTYAKGSGFLNKLGTKAKGSIGFGKKGESGARKFFTKADQLKYSGKSFLAQGTPFIKKLEKTANAIGKPLFEGTEEMFQETYEEWAQKKSFSDHTGEPMKYENYMDFFNSKENEATLAISFALGGLGGGSASLVQAINGAANENQKLWNATEMLKHGAERGNRESEMMFQWHVSESMISNKLNDSTVDNQEYVKQFYDEGKLTEEEYEQQLELADEIDSDYSQSESMNIRGKLAFLQNKSKKLFYSNAITEQQTLLEEKIANLQENITDDPKLLDKKIREATKDYDVLQTALKSELALATENVQNLISGQVATPSYTQFVKDENGKTVAVGLTEKQYEDFYNESDESILSKARSATLEEGKNFIQKLGTKAKSIFNSLKEKVVEKTAPKKEVNETTDDDFIDLITEENINDLTDEISLGKESIDLSKIKSLEGEERAEAIAAVNKQIKAYSQEVQKGDKTESKEPKDNTPKEVKVPVRLETIINDTYKSNRANNLTNAVKSIVKKITGFDLDISNPEEAKKVLLEFAKSSPNSSKLSKIIQSFDQVGDEQMLADYLFELYVENKTETTEETTEETEEETEDGKETAKEKIKRVAKKVNKAVRSVKSKFTGPTNTEIALQNRRQAELRTRIYSPDFEANPVSKNEIDAYLTSAIGKVTYGPTAINKAIALNHHLKALFPNQGIRAYSMTNLYNAVGIDAIGYAVLSSILIDEKVWEQDEVYMHEFLHIHYQVSRDEPFMQDFIERSLLKNKSLLNDVQNTYKELILFTDTVTGGTFERGAISEEEFLTGFKNGQFKVLPLREQDKILEEAFVHHMQGPLSTRFNKHFDARQEPLRKVHVKRLFGAFKKKAVENTISGNDLLEALSKGKTIPIGNIENHILDSFVEEIQGKNISTVGMASKVYEQNAQTISEENDIYNEWVGEINNKINSDLQETINEPLNLPLEEEYDENESVSTMVANELFVTKYDKSFETLEEKMGQIFKNFFEKYYTKLKEEWKVKNPKIAGFPSPFQEEVIKRQFMLLAKETDSPWQFINLLEKTTDPHLREFISYMGDIYNGNIYDKLVSAHMLYKNREVIPGIIHTLKKNGTYFTATALSVAEEKIIDNVLGNDKIDGDIAEIYDELVLQDPPISAIKKFFKILSNSSVNMKAIIDGNYLYVNNKQQNLKGAFLDLRTRGLLEDGGLNSTQEVMTAILNTNRQYSSMSVIKGPTGTQTSSAVLNNALTQLVKEIRNDLTDGISKTAFVKKYAHEIDARKRGLSEIKSANNKAQKQILSPLLNAWYDNFEATGEIPTITQDLGNRNLKTGESKDYKNSNPNEQLINEALLYINSINKGSNTYAGSLDVFGDSSRRYLISMPTYSKIIDSSGKLTINGENLMKAAYQSYTVSRVDESKYMYNEFVQENPLITYDNFKKIAMNDSAIFSDYINKTASDLSGISTLSGLFANGKMNALGKQAINQFTLSRFINSYLGHQTLNPGIPLNSIQKRNKGNISPVMFLDKNMRLEMLFVTDELTSDQIKRNDGGQYILEEDALLMQSQGEGVIDLNRGYKLFSHKTERQNPKFKGKTPQMKGYTSILTEEMVKPGGTQENLRPYWDLLQERKKKFADWYLKKYKEHYNPVYNTQGDAPKHMAIITPISAEKGSLLSSEDLEKLKQFSTLDELKRPRGKEEYNKIMDLFNYNKGEFHGLDGSNFGPQQVMDKEYFFTTFSVQSTSSLIVGAKGKDLTDALVIQDELRLHKQQNLEKGLIQDIGSPFLTQAVLKNMNTDLADHITVEMLRDGANVFSPHVNASVTYQIRKQAIRLGNNIKTPGTYAQTISDVGYKSMSNEKTGEEEFSLKPNEGLRYYGQDSNGKTIPMESILPKSQSKDTRKREKVYGVNSKDIIVSRITNSPLMKEFGLEAGEVEAFVESKKFYARRNAKNVHLGYYIPGEYVMMTRIPHNGPAFMAVSEVVAFNESGASNIVVPTKYKEIIGSDDDGDALFVYKAAKVNDGKDLDLKQPHWNKAFDLMKKQWQSARMYPFLTTALNFESKTNEAIEVIADDQLESNKAYTELATLRRSMPFRERSKDSEMTKEYKVKRQAIIKKYSLEQSELPFTTQAYVSSFNNSVVAKQTIGIGFNSHRLLNIIAAYPTRLSNPKTGSDVTLTIDGIANNGISDWTLGNGVTRVQRSTELTNILLDSTKNSQADPLKLNKDTVGMAMILVNMGYNITTIGKLFNHPVAIDYIEKFADVNNNYVTTGSRAQILNDFKNELENFDPYAVDNYSVTVTKKGREQEYNSKENSSKIIGLLNYLYKINNDISQLSNLMSGHKRLEINAHSLQKQIQDYEALVSNTAKNQTLEFGEGFSNNPEIQSYLHTAKEWNQITKTISLVFDDSVKNILDKISTSITSKELNPKQLASFSDLITRVIYARSIGVNNLDIEELSNIFDYNRPDSLDAEINAWKTELDSRIISEDPNDADLNITELDSSLIFNEALEVYTDEVSMAREFLTNKVFDKAEWNDVRNEFSQMPAELQKKLIMYDLIKYGWEGQNSFYPIFSKQIHDHVNQYLKGFVAEGNKVGQKRNPLLTSDMVNKIADALLQLEMKKDKNNLPKIFLNNQKDIDYSHSVIAAVLKTPKNRFLYGDKIRRGEAFYLEVRSINPNGIENGTRTAADRKFVKVNAIDPAIRNKILNTANTRFKNEGRSRKQGTFNRTSNFSNLSTKFLENVESLIENVEPVVLPNQFVPAEVLLVSQLDSKANGPINIVGLKKKDNSEIKRTKGGMAFKVDMSNFESQEPMSKARFFEASQFKKGTLQEDKESTWFAYQNQKTEANKQRDNIYTDDFIEKMSDEDLLKAYKDFGKKDKFAYSIILTPILLRMVDIASAEQSKVTGRTESTDDISTLKAYLQSNNIDSSHPATQAVQRELETEFKSFVNERKGYLRKVNRATENLYAEKFGLKRSSSQIWNKLKLAILSLVKDRQQIYMKLYGNLLNEKFEDGKKAYRLKSKSELDQAFKNGNISKAEYEFSEVFRNTISELNQFSNKPDQNSGGYVPAVAMSRLEAFSHNGLLGLLSNSRPDDHAINNVKIKFQGEILSFKEIEDIFRVQGKNNLKNIKEYVLIKNKAKKLLKLGQNEDGSIIQATSVSNRTLLGDGMINKFANDGFVEQEHMLSMDLNRALNDYVHTSLFVNGNDKFQGFTKLQSLVDGLLIHNKRKGFVNQNKFVQKVYKEYFLKGQRQQNSSTDNVINAFVKGNLLYVMGWKLLAIGKGAYVIGNMVVGKYNNVKNSGGKKWIKGEQRYWGMQNNGFKHRKSIGVLNSLNFMNINLYDDVSVEKSSGLDGVFSELIFLPMKMSEEWIQGVHYLGTLTDEQWNRYDDNGNLKEGEVAITNAELAVIENEVKNAHGKGYTPTDQRMVQQYSWGKAMMQFARFIPTMFYDRWAKEDINIYGEKHIGSLRTVKDLVEKVISGDLPISQFKTYRANLDPETRKQFDSALRGFAMMSVAIFVGQSFNIDTANELTGDANYLVNLDKLEHKFVPSSVQTLNNIGKSLYPF